METTNSPYVNFTPLNYSNVSTTDNFDTMETTVNGAYVSFTPLNMRNVAPMETSGPMQTTSNEACVALTPSNVNSIPPMVNSSSMQTTENSAYVPFTPLNFRNVTQIDSSAGSAVVRSCPSLEALGRLLRGLWQRIRVPEFVIAHCLLCTTVVKVAAFSGLLYYWVAFDRSSGEIIAEMVVFALMCCMVHWYLYRLCNEMLSKVGTSPTETA